MFTGLVEEVGVVKSIIRGRDSALLKISATKVLENSVLGDSIAINGACQTLVQFDSSSFTVDVLKETLSKTNLGDLSAGKSVNLERALTLNKPLGGHIVQGHVQGTGKVQTIIKSGVNTFLKIELKKELLSYMIPEGSICIDGLSLTIAKVERSTVTINIIPHTLKETTIGQLKPGVLVNIEPDILIKATLEKKSEGLTKEKLQSWGY